MLFVIRMLLLSVHFVVASLLGLLVSLFRPFNPDNSRIAARIYGIPALWIMGVRLRLELDDFPSGDRSLVVVANHLSNYDLFVFGPSVPPRTATLGKKSLKWIPLFGQLYWLAGNVMIERGNASDARRTMATITQTLQRKHMSIWIFPEGTRGHGKGLGPLKKGAFQVAIAAGAPIVPLCANNYVRKLDLNRWCSGEVVIRALPPVETTGMTLQDVPALMAKCHELMSACIADLDREAGTVDAAISRCAP